MRIEQFIALSEGVWKSMRSGHSLAFQQFEEIVSQINIRKAHKGNKEVSKLVSKSEFKESEITTPFIINWEAESNWESDNKSDLSKGSCILVPIPMTIIHGKMLRSIGYAEPIGSITDYNFLSDGTLLLSTKYEQSQVEERIWFVSDNVRCRSSVVRTSNGKGILQTSFASEIRQINLKSTHSK